mmetsp:Transcript_15586/g.33074  ORF Transcript_15586/g.33074 Transcript_15586/m.33074 type:complete len:631 (-) Transcript_15586:164-2056(-)
MPQIWEVVGGADKGGVLVREGPGTSSVACKDRLSTGALVEELELKGERIRYKLLTGTGPAEGWVSFKLPGKDLLVKTDKEPGGEEEAEEAAPETPAGDKQPAPEGFHHSDEVKAMIKERCEKELAKPPYQWQWITADLVTNNHMKKAPGVMYGMEFPWNEETLTEFGPEWLTKAMHKAGTISEDNKVTKIILEQKIKVTTGNNGGKFLFEVEWEKPSPDLHTKLFAKVPFALEGVTKNDRISSSVNKQPAELYEINAYRYLEHILPMKTPRFYFGDISNETSNWIIITERINFHDFNGNNFGKPKAGTPKPLPAWTIEGPYDKCIDYNLRGKHEEYYMLMTRVGAKMAGLAKAGKMGSPELLAASFRASGDPSNAMMWGMNPGGCTGEAPKQVAAKLKMACTFISDTGKVLFPKYAQSEKFLEKFKKVMMTVNAYSAEINYWMHMNPDITALGHMNLNVDNAYFWRDGEGKLDCGVFDWGGMGTSSYGSKLWWWYYCMDYEVFKKNLSKFLKAFAEAYEEAGGPKVDPKEMEPMVIMAAIQQMAGLVSAVPQILRMCPKKNWPDIKDRYDPLIAENVDGKSTIRLYLHCINTIIRIVEEMKGDKVVETFINDIYVGKLKQTKKTDAMIEG